MPSSKGGHESRKQNRKKAMRAKHISTKKNLKMKKRLNDIKARGNKCELAPVEKNVIQVLEASTIIDSTRTFYTPAEVNMVVATYSEAVGRQC